MSVEPAATRRLLSVAAVGAALATLTTPVAVAGTTPLTPMRSTVRALAAPNVFGGVTQQGWPVVVAISPDGRGLRAAVIGVTVTCTSGASFGVNDGFFGRPINRQGKVHASSTWPTLIDSSGTTSGSGAMSGTLDRRHATFTGWWRVQINHKSATGESDHCDSGQVHFTARD